VFSLLQALMTVTRNSHFKLCWPSRPSPDTGWMHDGMRVALSKRVPRFHFLPNENSENSRTKLPETSAFINELLT
jgi:hypothetical protein